MKAGLIAIGSVLIVLGIIVYVYPISSLGSVSDINDLCGSVLGQFGKAINQDAREGCQTAKYVVVGSYASIGIGALLVIVGSIIKTGTVSPEAKRTITIGIGIAAAIAIGAVAYQLSLQPDIQVSNLSVSTKHNNEFVKVLDHGRVSNSGDFYYTSPNNDSYYLVFSNDFSFISTKYVGVSYTDKGQYYSETFQVAPGTYKSIPVYAYSGKSVSGSFNVAGGSGNDVDFFVARESCSQSLSFSFSLANYGPVSGEAQVTLQSDGSSVWSNSYFVESQKQINQRGTATLSDCNQHEYKMMINSQKRVG